MRSNLFILIVILFTGKIKAQNISNIKISPKQKLMAYLKDDDSLFIKNLKDKSLPKLVFSGFNNDINNRFFIWNYNGKEFIFENKNSIYNYNAETSNIAKHTLPDSFKHLEDHIPAFFKEIMNKR